jgi:hypothetical protein
VWLNVLALSALDAFRDLPDSVARSDAAWRSWYAAPLLLPPLLLLLLLLLPLPLLLLPLLPLLLPSQHSLWVLLGLPPFEGGWCGGVCLVGSGGRADCRPRLPLAGFTLVRPRTDRCCCGTIRCNAVRYSCTVQVRR